MIENTHPKQFFVIGNNLCLDFINTEIVENGERKDLLANFEDLLAWAVATNILEGKQRAKLWREFGESPAGDQTFSRALDFRRGLRSMVEGLEEGGKVKPQILSGINGMLRAQSGYTELSQTEEGFAKRFRSNYIKPSEILPPVAEAAADLLCYGDVEFMKKCENPECVLHFYDTSKNHRRRWCSMAGCGNRAKAAAFYRRQREGLKDGSGEKVMLIKHRTAPPGGSGR